MDPIVEDVLVYLSKNIGTLIPFVTYLVFIFVIVRAVKRTARANKGTRRREADALREAIKSAGVSVNQSQLVRQNNGWTNRSSNRSVNNRDNRSQYRALNAGQRLRDDLDNDWLAKQLREEAKAKQYVTDMFQLKNSHSMNCDARSLRDYHADNCDAEGIDTATIR